MHTSERIIAKEQVPLLQRWQADSFDGPGGSELQRRHKLPTAAELETIQRGAYDEGYRTGIAEAQGEARRMAALLQTLSGAIDGMEAELAESLLSLAIELSGQMVRDALLVRRELVIPVVREAIQSLAKSYQRNVLLVNSADAELVHQHLGDELDRTGWKVQIDDRVEAGGCRVESALGDVDATLTERWKQLLASLGRSDAWLA
jgi:flagellar assembly protein FliH